MALYIQDPKAENCHERNLGARVQMKAPEHWDLFSGSIFADHSVGGTSRTGINIANMRSVNMLRPVLEMC